MKEKDSLEKGGSNLKGVIGKLGSYAIVTLVLSWITLTKAPGLVDASNNGLVLLGAILYILWIIAVMMISVDVVKTVKKIRRKN